MFKNIRASLIYFAVILCLLACTSKPDEIIVFSNYTIDDTKDKKHDHLLYITFNLINSYLSRILSNSQNKHRFTFYSDHHFINESAKNAECEKYKDEPELNRAISYAKRTNVCFLILSKVIPVDGINNYDVRYTVIEMNNGCESHFCKEFYRIDLQKSGEDIAKIRQIVTLH